jgi:synaptotagmin-like protein
MTTEPVVPNTGPSSAQHLLDLSFLDEDERKKIEDVLKRSCDEMKTEENRLNKLHTEIDEEHKMMRQHVQESSGRACPLCSTRFGIILNTGARCPHCFYKVCKQCRIPPRATVDFVCTLCEKRRVYRLGTSKVLKYEPSSPQDDDEIFGTQLVLKSLRNLEQFNRDFPQGELSRVMTLPAKRIMKSGPADERRLRQAKKVHPSQTPEGENERKENSNTINTLDLATQSQKVATTVEKNAPTEQKTVKEDKGPTDKKQKTGAEGNVRKESVLEAATKLPRRNSMSSQYSDYSGGSMRGDYDITGDILFGVEYFDGKVIVNVKRARGLAAVDRNGRADPYVKAYLLPDPGKESKKKTRVVKKNLDPIFNESLSYNVPQSELPKKTLWLSVWDWDRFGRNSFLGEVRVPLSELDLSEKMEKWWPLVDTVESGEEGNHGEIYLLLKAEPMGTSGLWSIAVNVKEGQNLPHKKHGGVDSFVKCCVLPDVKHCQKTKIVHDSSSPTWNTVLYFEELHPTQLDVAACLEVTVWDKGSKRNSHQFIGGLRIGPSPTTAGAASKEWLDSTPEEMSHWTTMMSSVGVWVGKWLPLRGTMRPRNSPGKSKSRSSSLKRLAKSNFSASSRTNRSSLTRRSDSPKSMSPGDPPNSSPTQGDPPSSSPAPEIVVDEEVTPNERRTDVEDVAGALSGGMRRSGSMGSLGSMQSTYSGEGGKGDYDITGEVLFGVQYSDGVLQIHVTSARDIAAASKGHTSNPYVKTYLLPDPKKSSKKKTRVVQKSLSPVYNEVLKYNVPQSELRSEEDTLQRRHFG